MYKFDDILGCQYQGLYTEIDNIYIGKRNADFVQLRFNTHLTRLRRFLNVHDATKHYNQVLLSWSDYW